MSDQVDRPFLIRAALFFAFLLVCLFVIVAGHTKREQDCYSRTCSPPAAPMLMREACICAELPR